MRGRPKTTPKKFVTDWGQVPVVFDLGYLAMLLGCSREKARLMCAGGSIPAVRLDGMWRINKHDMMKFFGVPDEGAQI